MFVGRESEIKELLKTFQTPGHHSVIYGNRRVGKTTLVNQSAKQSDLLFVSYECLKSSLNDNVRQLSTLFYGEGIFPVQITFSSIIDLFNYVNSLNMHIIVLIDEYPYLYYKNDKNEVDSLFQSILDKCLNINIVLSGSHIGMMKNLLKENNPIFGRIHMRIHLKELNYLEASVFYPSLSNYDKVAMYAIFGGSPYILQQLDETKSLKENICNTFLNPTSSIFSFVSEGYTTDLIARDSANQIFEKIGNSKLRHNRIEQLLEYEHNGLLSKQLNTLLEMEFIGRNAPINKMNDKKKVSYFIKNNALRFYFTYLYGRANILSMIGAEQFFDRYIKDSVYTFVSYRFEEIAKSFISMLVKEGKIKNVANIGSYYYDDSIKKENGEFDVAIQVDNYYDIIEVKYFRNKVNNQIIREEIAQIKNIKEIDVKHFGFISINGYEEKCKDLEYQFDGDDLFFVKK